MQVRWSARPVNLAMVDVAIIGGGPAGSTAASILKKYNPALNVLILERELFPREKVGESQLPPISGVLEEMGCWDKVEAANFPIKIGATYRWGNTKDLWDFELYPAKDFKDEPRPAKFEGQRRHTAFQVERAIYDKILLDHAESLGTEVRQETKVSEIMRDGDRITGLKLESGEVVTAKYYLDGSGTAGIMRRAMGVEIDAPTTLRNVAIWDYWNDTDWAFSIGNGGTRVLVMSLGYGWIWFIPIGPTRTSIGLVCPAEYYKNSGLSKEELYAKALADEPKISELIKDAKADGTVRATKDWSFISERMYGENWFLMGEAAGFADPILAAGMTMAHVGAKELAYTVNALLQGKEDPAWLKEQYEYNQRTRILQHIRFADFWYTANGIFTDVKEFTREIAKDAGLELDAQKAFQWLGTGGFIDENLGSGFAGFALSQIKDTVELMLQEDTNMMINQYNVFSVDMSNAKDDSFAYYHEGEIIRKPAWKFGETQLPRVGFYNVLIQIINHNGELPFVLGQMIRALLSKGMAKTEDEAVQIGMSYLESLLQAGIVKGEYREDLPKFSYDMPKLAVSGIKMNDDTFVAV